MKELAAQKFCVSNFAAQFHIILKKIIIWLVFQVVILEVREI